MPSKTNALHPTRPSPRFLQRHGPWAVVTGASDGIGRELAVRLAARGLSVVLVARREAVLDALGAELRATFGVDVRALPLDLATPGAAEVLAEKTADLDVGLLVASAGFGTSGAFVDNDVAEELAMIDVNVRAVAALAHAFARRFVARGRGGLVLMSSLLAFQGVPRAANYAATKAWVQTFAEGLRHELAPHGVDVIACAPGPIASGFGARAKMKMGMVGRPEEVADATLDALGRWGTIRPGFLSKLLEWSLTPLPRWGRVRVLAKVMRGMTPHGAQAAGR